MTIKNGDLPASPTIYADLASNVQRELYCTDTGLTKREMFAMAAMQGLLGANINWNKTGFDDVGHDAVKCADALLAELERTK